MTSELSDLIWGRLGLSAVRAVPLEEGDALVLSPRDHGAFRPAHVGHRESGHRAAEDPPVHPFMERLIWVDVTYCKHGTPYRKQTRLWTNMRWRPSRGLCRSGSRCDVWEDGRHQGGPRLMGGQRERVRGQLRKAL